MLLTQSPAGLINFLSTELSHIKLSGLGEKSLRALSEHHVHTVADLLLCLPLRYRVKNRLSGVKQFQDNQYYCVQGLIVGIDKRSKVTKITVQDSHGDIFYMTFFYFSPWHQRCYDLGKRVYIWGQARAFQGTWEMSHPELETGEHGQCFKPRIECVYPKMGKLSSKLLHKALDALWPYLLRQAPHSHSFCEQELLQALRYLHALRLDAQELEHFEDLLPKARQKMADFEALHYFYSLHQKQFCIDQQGVILRPGAIYQQLLGHLPFSLTAGQQEVINDIIVSFSQGDLVPRLVQGDVGSGKTIIGLLAMCCALDHGEQAVMMAPTELLARQHYDNICQLLPDYQEMILYLSGSLSQRARQKCYDRLNQEGPLMIIGTHAVFQQQVCYHSLRVMVIDEQQRFGVEQRAQLLAKSAQYRAYQITLSATPIPRTLAMATYGPVTLSLLRHKPAGRQEIKTYTLSSAQMEIVDRSVLNCVNSKQQCYWVCPLISESEHIQAQDVEQAYERLCQRFPTLTIAMIHGQVAIDSREEILQQFKKGCVDVLVSTLVIEVGVDSPTASLMVIQSPERLGLSQLHQLRGRVGRSHLPGYCILVYDSYVSEQGIERLKALCESQDGFYLSDVDLKLRGPGHVLGTRQSGQEQFKFFDLSKDEHRIASILERCQQVQKDELSLLVSLFGPLDCNPYV